LSEQSDFRLKPIHAPIKIDIGRDRFCACITCEADLVAVLSRALAWKLCPFSGMKRSNISVNFRQKPRGQHAANSIDAVKDRYRHDLLG